MEINTPSRTHTARKILITGTLATLLSGCVIHIGEDHDLDWDHGPKVSMTRVWGDLNVPAGQDAGNVKTVNGDIDLSTGSSANHIETVNGDIGIQDDVSVRSIDVVNGDINTGVQFFAESDIHTVNGDIDFGQGSKIGGSVTTVNGDIDMSQTEISYHLRTTNGDMHISGNSVIEGDIVYETVSKNQWKRSQHPKLRIEKGSTVKGAIILKRPVKLHIDDPDLLAKVQEHFHTNE